MHVPDVGGADEFVAFAEIGRQFRLAIEPVKRAEDRIET